MGRSITRRSVLRTAGLATAVPLFNISRGKAADKVIHFGGSLGMSGRYGETGLNVRMGYEAAIKFFNEALGGAEIGGKKYQLELGIIDDASDPGRATTLIQRQLDDGIDFFLGSYGSNIVLPSAAITEQAGKVTVQVGGSADQIFTQGFKRTFGFFPRATRAWDTSVSFFKALSPKPATISIVATNDAFSKGNAEGAARVCKENGFEVLDIIQLPATVTDASSALATIRSRSPDILITTTVDQNSLVIARQMISTDTNVKLLYQFLGPQLPLFRQTFGPKATGIVGQLYWDEGLKVTDPFFGTTKNYIEFYNAHFSRPISYHTVGASACITTYVKAMQKAGSLNPDAVRDALASTDLETVFGRVKFSPEGDGDAIVMGAKIGQVQGGAFEIVSPADSKTADVIYPTRKWSDKI